MTPLQHFKLFVMFTVACLRRESFVEAVNKRGQIAFAAEPDWVVGTLMHALRTAQHADSRRLYAIACAEWTDRQVGRKMLAHAASQQTGPAARP